MPRGSCASCEWWVETGGTSRLGNLLGKCHEDAPLAGGGEDAWPLTRDTDFCSHWLEREREVFPEPDDGTASDLQERSEEALRATEESS